MAKIVENRYKDFDISLEKSTTGDIYTLKDIDAVKRSVKLLVLTNLGERPFSPNLGSDVYRSLFENADAFTAITLKRKISDVINNFEPRARLIKVDVNFDNIDNNSIGIDIHFYVVNIPEPVTVKVNLERVR